MDRILIIDYSLIVLQILEDCTRPYAIQGIECDLPHPHLFLQLEYEDLKIVE
jgi:hypothetical protein